MARSAVEGLQEFQQHMQEAAGSYALIGGTACDILLAEAGLPFRATHDFDVVIVADDRLPQTAEAIWTLCVMAVTAAAGAKAKAHVFIGSQSLRGRVTPI